MTRKPTNVNKGIIDAERTRTAQAPSDSDSRAGGHFVVCACKTRVKEVLPLATAAAAKQPCISTQCGVNVICT